MQTLIQEEIEKIKSQSLLRTLTFIDEQKCINFSSNDYLGYSRRPEVIAAAKEAVDQFGAGGRSSRLISGTLKLHTALEKKLAEFKGTESALVFPSGFMANLGVISSLLGEGDAIIMDRLSHASLIDAAKLARCRLFIYPHCSLERLEKILKRTRVYKKRLVVTDSLFSMDGDIAPLREIIFLCKKYHVWLMIDDAHATGVLGKDGIGAQEHLGLLGQIEIVMGTLSKALGSQGGFVCGSKELIQLLINRARSFIYTTALSPAACASALAAIRLVEQEPEKRRQLLATAKSFRETLKRKFPSNPTLLRSESQIVPLQIDSVKEVLEFSDRLKNAGFYVPAIRPPTVPKNECRLRFSLTTDHTEEQINALLHSIK